MEATKEYMVDEEEAFGKGSEGVLMAKFIFVFILYVLVWAPYNRFKNRLLFDFLYALNINFFTIYLSFNYILALSGYRVIYLDTQTSMWELNLLKLQFLDCKLKEHLEISLRFDSYGTVDAILRCSEPFHAGPRVRAVHGFDDKCQERGRTKKSLIQV